MKKQTILLLALILMSITSKAQLFPYISRPTQINIAGFNWTKTDTTNIIVMVSDTTTSVHHFLSSSDGTRNDVRIPINKSVFWIKGYKITKRITPFETEYQYLDKNFKRINYFVWDIKQIKP